MIDTLVVIPTYNSSNSIVELVNQILSQTKRTSILVVDDSSPDKTALLVKNYFEHEKRVHVVIRPKKGGRGSAILFGFQKGLSQEKYHYFIEMDSDLCHDPRYISQLVEACSQWDVAIASRYMKNSEIIGWGIKRKLLSNIMNTVLGIVLRIPITDYTNGYRCYRKKALQSIDFTTLHAKGFILLSEIAYQLYKKGNTFTQIPIRFVYKDLNPSNLNKEEMKEVLRFLLQIMIKYHILH